MESHSKSSVQLSMIFPTTPPPTNPPPPRYQRNFDAADSAKEYRVSQYENFWTYLSKHSFGKLNSISTLHNIISCRLWDEGIITFLIFGDSGKMANLFYKQAKWLK